MNHYECCVMSNFAFVTYTTVCVHSLYWSDLYGVYHPINIIFHFYTLECIIQRDYITHFERYLGMWVLLFALHYYFLLYYFLNVLSGVNNILLYFIFLRIYNFNLAVSLELDMKVLRNPAFKWYVNMYECIT